MSITIDRLLAPKVLDAQKYFPVITITGPRQSGKTYLCRHLFPEYRYVNLEDITFRALCAQDPTGFLDSLGKYVIIDEVQNVPDILSMIQVRVDEDKDRRYILTGSSNFSLLRSISQSLAGRTALFTLLPFSLKEIDGMAHDESIDNILLQGLYPRVIADNMPSDLYYRSYYNTYVERDLRDLLKVKNIVAFDTFIRLLAARVGSEFNASALAREVGVSSVTIKEWFSILMTSYIVFPLQSFFRNISKQLTKMPKIYFYDTGLLCFLLGIDSKEKLESHHLRGALFENLAICELLKGSYNEGKEPRLYFYREKSGIEIDAISENGSELHLYEIKSRASIQADDYKNMNDLESKVSQPVRKTIIYDGDTISTSAVNIREI